MTALKCIVSAALAIVMIAGLPSCGGSDHASLPPSAVTLIKSIDVELDGGYTLTISVDDDNSLSVTERRTVEYNLLSQHETMFSVETVDGTTMGSGCLNIYTADTGSLYFLETQYGGTLTLTLHHPNAADAQLRTITYGEPTFPEPVPLGRNSNFDADTSFYIEGGGAFVKSGRLMSLEALENTTYKMFHPDYGAVVTLDSDGLTVAVTLTGTDGRMTAYHGAACTAPTVDWDTYYRGMKVVNFDATNNYTFLSDGHYYDKPTNYEPIIESEQPLIYKTAASFVHRSAVEQNSGAYLRALGLYLMYSRIDSYNEQGFVPNPCRSQWLFDDYGIDGLFYDTRFNTSAIDALMLGKSAGDEPLVDQTITAAIEYFRQYYAATQFEAHGSKWAPDYGNHDQTVFCNYASLNHFIAEGMMLIEVGTRLEREDWVADGYNILDQIEQSYSIWIKPNGDLWYGVDNTGEMFRDDYVSVTYNDLVACIRLLGRMGKPDSYPGIRALYESKENWLIASGHEQYVTKP